MTSSGDATIPFGDLVDFAIGGGWGSEDAGEVPVTIIRGTDFATAERGDLSPCPRRFETRKRAERRAVRAGDILLEISGGSKTSGQTTGRSVLISDAIAAEGRTVIPASFCRLLRLDANRIQARYAYYHLREMYLSGRAGRYETQSTGISNFQFKYFLENERVRLPPLVEQKRIAWVLGSLDDRIANSRRMAATLEQIAATVFKARFVDFVDQGDLVGSDLGPIPRGWDVQSIYEIASVTYGRPFKSSLFSTEEGIPLIRIRDLVKEEPSVRTPEERSDARLITSGDLVVGMDGEFRAHSWFGPDAWLNQRVCAFDPVGGAPRAFVLEAIRRPLAFFEATKSGTTVIHLGKADIDTFQVVKPPAFVMASFAEQADPLLAAAVALRVEARTLGTVRDALLPRLVSGALRVSQGDVPAEAA